MFFVPENILDLLYHAALSTKTRSLSIELVVDLQCQTQALSLQRRVQALRHQYKCCFPRVGERVLPACNLGWISFPAGRLGGRHPNF